MASAMTICEDIATNEPTPSTALNCGGLRVELSLEGVNGPEVAFNGRFEGTIVQFASVSGCWGQVLPEQRMIDMAYWDDYSQHHVEVTNDVPPPLNFNAACNAIWSLGFEAAAYDFSAAFKPFT